MVLQKKKFKFTRTGNHEYKKKNWANSEQLSLNFWSHIFCWQPCSVQKELMLMLINNCSHQCANFKTDAIESTDNCQMCDKISAAG